MKLPKINVATLDEVAITPQDYGILIEYIMGNAHVRGVILEYGGKKITMVPESCVKNIGLAARDVVKCHTPGRDLVMDKFVQGLANLSGDGQA